MKYFSLGSANGDLTDDDTEQARRAYLAGIEQLLPGMPPAIAELTRTSLHDALVDRIVWNAAKRELEFKLIGSTDDEGPFEVRLVYGGVEVSSFTLDLLAVRARDRRTEVLHDEVDVGSNGGWVHRVLFWPDSEVSIWFHTLELTRTARTDKRWDCLGDPFQLSADE